MLKERIFFIRKINRNIRFRIELVDMQTMNAIYCLLVVIAPLVIGENVIVLDIMETDSQGTLILNNTGSENCSLTQVSPHDDIREYFRFDDEQNLVLEKPLDLEVIYTFYKPNDGINLTVKCTGEPEIQMSIKITPVNEFNPEFIRKPYVAVIPEDAPIGSPVFCLYCSDPGKLVIDGDHIKYGDVSNFTFIPHEIQGLDGAHKFTIDPATGNITTRELFDYESRNRLFYVKVQVQDEGGRTGDASIRINVSDVDDNPPKFTRPECDDVICAVTKYSVDIDSFLEGKVTNISPYQIYAKDIDSGLDNPLEFTLLSDDDDELVSNIRINSSTGEVFVHEPFNNVTNVTDNAPITLAFDVTATELSPNGYSTNATLIITIYRSLTTLPPSTTRKTPETTRVLILPLSDDSGDDIALLLVEIFVPAIIVIGITVAIIVIFVRRSRKMKERSKYDVKDGVKVYHSVIGDRDLAVQATSPLVINPYELVALYETSHYAKLDSMRERGEIQDQGQGQIEGHVEGQAEGNAQGHVDGEGMESNSGNESESNEQIPVEAIDIDSMYARVDKKRPKSSKSDARDVFGSDNHGIDIHEGEHDITEDELPDGYKDVKNIEY